MPPILPLLVSLLAGAVPSAPSSAPPSVPAGALSGNVKLGGLPVPAATIIVAADLPAADVWPGGPAPSAPDAVFTAISNGNGTFRFPRLAARRWYIYVRHPGVRPEAGQITVLPPPAETHVDLELKPAPTVRGRVTNPDGRPAVGVTVRMSADPGSFSYPDPRVQTDDRGNFELGQGPAGKAWLEAYAADGRMAAVRLDLTATDHQVRDLMLAPADDPGTLRIRAMGNHGRPLANAWIGAGPERRTDGSGRWRSRRYLPGAPIPDVLMISWKSGFFPCHVGRLPTAAGAEVVVTVPDGVIEVALPTDRVSVVLLGPDEARGVGTPDGRVVRFELLPEGHWTLYAHHPDHRMGQLDIDLGPGQSKRVDAPLGEVGRTVRGRFLIPERRPLGRLDVETSCWTLPFTVLPSGKISLTDNGVGSQTARADAEGRFTLVGLHPGRHVVYFSENFESRRLLFLDVPAQGTAPIDLGEIKASDFPLESKSERFLASSQEGVVVWKPSARRRMHGLERGDLLLEVDGQPVSSDREALALLDDPARPHRALVRGSAKTVVASCPPAGAGTGLPTRLMFDLPHSGTDPALAVRELPTTHPWIYCLRTGDVLTAVVTDWRVVRMVNGQGREALDAALASGRPEKLEVKRRGPPRWVEIPAAR